MQSKTTLEEQTGKNNFKNRIVSVKNTMVIRFELIQLREKLIIGRPT